MASRGQRWCRWSRPRPGPATNSLGALGLDCRGGLAGSRRPCPRTPWPAPATTRRRYPSGRAKNVAARPTTDRRARPGHPRQRCVATAPPSPPWSTWPAPSPSATGPSTATSHKVALRHAVTRRWLDRISAPLERPASRPATRPTAASWVRLLADARQGVAAGPELFATFRPGHRRGPRCSARSQPRCAGRYAGGAGRRDPEACHVPIHGSPASHPPSHRPAPHPAHHQVRRPGAVRPLDAVLDLLLEGLRPRCGGPARHVALPRPPCRSRPCRRDLDPDRGRGLPGIGREDDDPSCDGRSSSVCTGTPIERRPTRAARRPYKCVAHRHPRAAAAATSSHPGARRAGDRRRRRTRPAALAGPAVPGDRRRPPCSRPGWSSGRAAVLAWRALHRWWRLLLLRPPSRCWYSVRDGPGRDVRRRARPGAEVQDAADRARAPRRHLRDRRRRRALRLAGALPQRRGRRAADGAGSTRTSTLRQAACWPGTGTAC